MKTLALVDIAFPCFQDFDRGSEITQLVPLSACLCAGDRAEWECGQTLNGTLEVIAVGEVDGRYINCTLRKIS